MSTAKHYPTYAELVARLEKDLDLEGENFVQPEELLSKFNEAVRSAAKIVQTLYEDYFLDSDTITLVDGTDEYVLPSRIYANKIRSIIYRNGSLTYPVHRFKDWKKFEGHSMGLVIGKNMGDMEYHYFQKNSAAGEPKILFTPPVGENGEFIKVWFLREVNSFVSASDILDIPEAEDYVIRHVKTACYEKEGHPNAAMSQGFLQKEQDLLESTLAAMAPDAENEIEQDLSFYEDFN